MILQLIKLAGDQVSEEIWYRVIQIITNQGDELQKYATETVWRALAAEKLPHRTLVKVAGYVLGEFGHMIADQPESNAQKQVEVLTALYASAEPEVRALLLNTFVKLAHSYAEIVPQVRVRVRLALTLTLTLTLSLTLTLTLPLTLTLTQARARRCARSRAP